MSSAVRAKIVRIGNSQGVRIPKVLLEQAGLGAEVEMSAQKDRLVIRPARQARAGWEEQFQQMADRGDDRAMAGVPASLSKWDEEEWQWE